MTKLKLRASRITSKGIAQHIRKFANVVSIDLGETNIDDDALTSLGTLSKLEDLNLLRTHVTNKGLESLVPLKLKRLNLDDIASVGDETIPIVATIKTLEFLHLGKTHVTDKGLEGLVSLSRLKDLIVTNTVVSRESVVTLQSKLPDLKIKYGNEPLPK